MNTPTPVKDVRKKRRTAYAPSYHELTRHQSLINNTPRKTTTNTQTRTQTHGR